MKTCRAYIGLLIGIAGLTVASCNRNSIYDSEELAKVLTHYQSHPEKRLAAEFIIDNMAEKGFSPDTRESLYLNDQIDSLTDLYGHEAVKKHLKRPRVSKSEVVYRDVDCILADSLIASIDHSFEIWSEKPWAAEYSPLQFYRFVLPYRIRREPLEYYWKQDLYNRFAAQLRPEDTLLEQVAKLNALAPFDFNTVFMKTGLQSYSSMKQTRRGRCDDGTALKAMMLRAVGIPAAIDYVPYWGSQNNGHSMCVYIQPDGTGLDIEKLQKNETSKFEHKATKIYRYVYEIQRESILYKYRDSDEIPELFRDFSSIDVTSQHDVDVVDVNVDYAKTDKHIAYLSVFSRNGWIPVAYTKAGKKQAVFSDVGIGQTNGVSHSKGLNIGDGVVYLPSFYSGNEIIPAGPAFILNQIRKTELIPDWTHPRTIVLDRKYPARSRIVNFAKAMQHGIFEVANRADFSDAEIIYTINRPPYSHIQKFELPNIGPRRYVRYIRESPGFSIAEIALQDISGNGLYGTPICDPNLDGMPGIGNIFDRDILTYFELNGAVGLWVGLDLGRPTEIGSVSFCPRTDGNCIELSDRYELFYWDNKWISLGQQTAVDYKLTYENAPENALFWLRNLTKGIEERPFTYENGKQIWW